MVVVRSNSKNKYLKKKHSSIWKARLTRARFQLLLGPQISHSLPLTRVIIPHNRNWPTSINPVLNDLVIVNWRTNQLKMRDRDREREHGERSSKQAKDSPRIRAENLSPEERELKGKRSPESKKKDPIMSMEKGINFILNPHYVHVKVWGMIYGYWSLPPQASQRDSIGISLIDLIRINFALDRGVNRH